MPAQPRVSGRVVLQNKSCRKNGDSPDGGLTGKLNLPEMTIRILNQQAFEIDEEKKMRRAYYFLSRQTVLALFVLLCSALTIHAQTTAFTYQGKLTDGGAPANGTYDLQFTLFDGASAQVGAP